MNAFIRPRPVNAPALRLIGFHHAGGSAGSYHRMGRHLPDDWDLLLYDLPGRGRRHAEPPAGDWATVLRRVLADLADLDPSDEVPTAFFGHSFGAVVALETARALAEAGRPPVWVGVSGHLPPSVRPPYRLTELDDPELLNTLVTMGGVPRPLAEMPEVALRLLRLTRADLHAAESYAPAPDRHALPCPLTVFGGSSDPWAPRPQMGGWARETRAACRWRYFPGGHFYLLGPALPKITVEVVSEIRRAAPRAVWGDPACA
ncbi:alpha/beta fold hydrolase [Streptomyces coacervatus]|uniref:Alpha/beta fold hydrolase n=1 Tax=Streptomyces coacervatus TaxID=647381 RepID=A0ABP7IR96_9ACTN|nr:alpha/beta fold hydrolase [Streptomyces coacervatus]MDF2266833.1 alpha/beta fold hydrolase [Streptomyces coacervatus]